MLGNEFADVLSSDDFSVYNGVIVGAQQKCLAHLRRHLNPHSALLNTVKSAECGFKTRLTELLNTWQGHVCHAAGLLLRSLREKAHQWWYFLDHPSIPPDNNLAERSLRLAVTKRKVSGGASQ